MMTPSSTLEAVLPALEALPGDLPDEQRFAPLLDAVRALLP